MINPNQKKNRPRSSYVSKNDPLKCIARSSNPRHPDKEKWYLRGILSRFLTVYATRTVWYNRHAVDSFQQEGGGALDIIITFFLSVIASVVAYYICKWLDGEA